MCKQQPGQQSFANPGVGACDKNNFGRHVSELLSMD
jgi:hypothetical protein